MIKLFTRSPISLHAPDDADAILHEPAASLIDYVFRMGATLVATPEVLSELARTGMIDAADAPPNDWMGVPIKQDGQVVGVLAAQADPQTGMASGNDFRLLEHASIEIDSTFRQAANTSRRIDVKDRVQQLINKRNDISTQNDPAHAGVDMQALSSGVPRESEAEKIGALNQELAISRDEIRELIHQVIDAREEERRRISRMLHDESIQDLLAIEMTMSWLHSRLPAEAVLEMERLNEAIRMTGATIEQMRRLTHDMRPIDFDSTTPSQAIANFCATFSERGALHVFFDGATLPPLPESISICLYRAVQEGLTNAARHSGASQVWVTLAMTSDASNIVLTISDDGCGFDLQAYYDNKQPSHGVGLQGMSERFKLLHGSFNITSSPGTGTQLTGRIPWSATNRGQK